MFRMAPEIEVVNHSFLRIKEEADPAEVRFPILLACGSLMLARQLSAISQRDSAPPGLLRSGRVPSFALDSASLSSQRAPEYHASYRPRRAE